MPRVLKGFAFASIMALLMLLTTIVILIGLLVCWLSEGCNPWVFTKDFLVPIFTPLVVAFLAAMLGRRLDSIRNEVAELQQQGQIMRDVILSQDRRDVSFLIALCSQLDLHLGKFMESGDPFHSRATFYFHCLLRVARINFLATKGSVVYPRLWIEEGFHALVRFLVYQFSDGEEPTSQSLVEEAAIYKFFGGAEATSRVVTQKSGGDVSVPVLYDFCSLLEGTGTGDDKLHADIRKAFNLFSKRLMEGRVDAKRVRLAASCLETLDILAFNSMFSVWYKRSYLHELPSSPPADPPPAFIEEWGPTEQDRSDSEAAWQFLSRELCFWHGQGLR